MSSIIIKSMPQVSRRKLKKDVLGKILGIFFDFTVGIKNKRQAEQVLSEVLTPTERVMIAKRIACFYLLYKKIPGNQIADTLKLSTSTVTYFKHLFDTTEEIKKFFSKKSTEEKIKRLLGDILVELMYGGLRKGSDWKSDKQFYYEHKRKRESPL